MGDAPGLASALASGDASSDARAEGSLEWPGFLVGRGVTAGTTAVV